MEGRARARPNDLVIPNTERAYNLQWRAGHVPGQTDPVQLSAAIDASLQWRAGHVPGQTIEAGAQQNAPRVILQWRAGHVPGQTSRQPAVLPLGTRPSMEGRARARPNRSLDLVGMTCVFAGICERSRKRELRRYVDCVVKLRIALCHKAIERSRGLVCSP